MEGGCVITTGGGGGYILMISTLKVNIVKSERKTGVMALVLCVLNLTLHLKFTDDFNINF